MTNTSTASAPIEHTIASGRTAHVHWHVTKQIYSIKESGRPVYYVRELTMKNVRFHVDPRLRKMFEERPTRRTVHALLKGQIVSASAIPVNGVRIVCNPFAFAGFRTSDGIPVASASLVTLAADRTMTAIEPISLTEYRAA